MKNFLPSQATLGVLLTATATAAPQTTPGLTVQNLGLAVGTNTFLEGREDLFVIRSEDDQLFAHRFSTSLTTPLGPSNQSFQVFGGSVFYRIDESEALVDLNGDSDLEDFVLHRFDAETGQIQNYGVAGLVTSACGNLAAGTVWEPSQGATDLNGDGDTSDRLLFTLDLATDVLTITGVSASNSQGPICGEDEILVTRIEEMESIDLNSDGDQLDLLVYRFAPATGALTATGLENAFNIEHHGSDVFTGLSNEEVDLNGDGDPWDNLPFAISQGGVVQLIPVAVLDKVASSDLLAFRVSEFFNGQTDFNGDGDTNDMLLRVLNISTGVIEDFGLEPGNFIVSGDRLLAEFRENEIGADLTGDGDLFDEVLHHYDGSTGQLKSLGLQSFSPTMAGPWSTTMVEEDLQGSDLNGDGDLLDNVLMAIDLQKDSLTQLTEMDFPMISAKRSGNLSAFLVPESAVGADLNGDTDLLDRVVQVFDLATGERWNTGLASAPNFSSTVNPPFTVAGNRLVIAVSEADQGASDLNGDFDADDFVLAVVPIPTGTGLVTEADDISLAAGGVQRFSLDAGFEQAGELHWLLGSATGTTPGLPLGAFELPLVFDGYTQFTLSNPNTPPARGFLGGLDANGASTGPSFELAAGQTNPSLAGLELHHAFVAFDLLGEILHVSNAVGLTLVP